MDEQDGQDKKLLNLFKHHSLSFMLLCFYAFMPLCLYAFILLILYIHVQIVLSRKLV